eukprot:Phypoly_transcript_27122.p1 GENE.Phypoly_transcript_27122~~Phypoly_transcript_27122.p1  ORF type:complete len:157 (+),score=47.42 Phypoly_transcript_27122:1-471(+)
MRNTSSPFSHPLDHLPPSLKKMELWSKTFNHPLDHLPPLLTHLHLYLSLFSHPLDHLPPLLSVLALKNFLDFQHPLDHLPPYLLSFSFDNPILPLDHLPSFLQVLNIFFGYEPFPLRHLPSSLIYVDCRPPQKIVAQSNCLVNSYLQNAFFENYEQ